MNNKIMIVIILVGATPLFGEQTNNKKAATPVMHQTTQTTEVGGFKQTIIKTVVASTAQLPKQVAGGAVASTLAATSGAQPKAIVHTSVQAIATPEKLKEHPGASKATAALGSAARLSQGIAIRPTFAKAE